MTAPEVRVETLLAELAEAGELAGIGMVTNFVVVIEGITDGGGDAWHVLAPHASRLAGLYGMLLLASEDIRLQTRKAIEVEEGE